MTVIASDGRFVAADKQAGVNGSIRTVTKLRTHGRQVLAFNGTADHGMMMMQWFVDGADPKTFPTVADTKSCAWLNVFELGMPVRQYECFPVPIYFEDACFATGSGGDLARGAMAAGATAEEAVEIACRWEASCGVGVTVIDLEELARDHAGGLVAGEAAAEGGPPAAA